jgi:hypothetical protein
MSPNAGGGGGGGVAGSQPMSTAVHRNPNKLVTSNFIFNLMVLNIGSFLSTSFFLFHEGVDGELADAGAGLEAVLPGLVPPPPSHQTLTHLLIWSR